MKKPASKIPAGKVQAYAETNGLPPGRSDNLTRETAPASSPKLRLETAIQEERAFMLLMSDPPEEFCGSRGDAIQAGISSLSLRVGDELAAAFYAAEGAA